jgi:glycopeptide antibiotics resistance protein
MSKYLRQFLASRLFYWIRKLQFGLALFIFAFVALMPGGMVPKVSSDQSLHFAGNVLLFLSASVALLGSTRLVLLAVFLVPYSMLIEICQWLTPTRTVDPHDALANMAGLFCGYGIVLVGEFCWKKLLSPTQQTANT